MDTTTTTMVGVDLAKRVISTCRFDRSGKVMGAADYKFSAFAAFLSTLAAGTVVAMEACSTAHYWARVCQALGLVPKLMAAEFVTPFRKRKSAKNDRADAEAVGIAAQQPTMRFVSVKTEEQQARLAWHRMREGWKEERTALICRVRGLLLEFGYPIPNGAEAFRRGLVLSCEDSRLPVGLRQLLREAKLGLVQLDERMAKCDLEIALSARNDEDARRLQAVGGIGPLTSDAVCATVCNALNFKNGRQFAAFGFRCENFPLPAASTRGAIGLECGDEESARSVDPAAAVDG